MGVNSCIWDNHSVLLKEGIMSYKMFQALIIIVPQVFGPSPAHIQNICILSALNCPHLTEITLSTISRLHIFKNRIVPLKLM